MSRMAVYDCGMLIALVHRDQRAATHHRQIIRHSTPLVPGPVLALVWRTGPAIRFALNRLLRDCEVVTGYGVTEYKRIGIMLGAVSLPPKKRPDMVDALVVLTAAQYGATAILTSDPGDITAYTETVPKAEIAVIPV